MLYQAKTPCIGSLLFCWVWAMPMTAAIGAMLDSDTWDRRAIARAAGERYGAERVGGDFAAIYTDALERRRR